MLFMLTTLLFRTINREKIRLIVAFFWEVQTGPSAGKCPILGGNSLFFLEIPPFFIRAHINSIYLQHFSVLGIFCS